MAMRILERERQENITNIPYKDKHKFHSKTSIPNQNSKTQNHTKKKQLMLMANIPKTRRHLGFFLRSLWTRLFHFRRYLGLEVLGLRSSASILEPVRVKLTIHPSLKFGKRTKFIYSFFYINLVPKFLEGWSQKL